MKVDEGYIAEWRIENFSHWCKEVHGECIESPKFYYNGYCSNMELFPKGSIGGQEENLVVRFCNTYEFSGDLSFYCSNGALLCKQPVNAEKKKHLELPPGPKFEDVLSRMRESGDFITLRCWIKISDYLEQCMRTTINVLKVSLQINPSWIEKMKSDETIHVCYIQMSPNEFHKGISLDIWSNKNNTVNFKIGPPHKNVNAFAVEMCMSLTRSDGTVVRRVEKQHVFRRNDSPWTFLESLGKTELEGKVISLLLCLKTTDKIQSPSYVKWRYSSVSIEPNNTVRFTEKETSTDPVTSNQDSVSVLTEDFMCLYQDQNFSDITLKCDNVSFPVHKAILSARSPVFKTMLATDMTEVASNEVDIGDLDPSTLSRFLTYLYTGAVEDFQCDTARKLYNAADKYQVPSLKSECAKFLCDNVSVSNVCDIVSLAHQLQDDNLETGSRNFILNNYNEVLGSNEWKSFMKNEPVLAVETLTYFGEKDFLDKRNP